MHPRKKEGGVWRKMEVWREDREKQREGERANRRKTNRSFCNNVG